MHRKRPKQKLFRNKKNQKIEIEKGNQRSSNEKKNKQNEVKIDLNQKEMKEEDIEETNELTQRAKWVQTERLKYRCMKMRHDLKIERTKPTLDQNRI